ncbi:hypothetical protein BT96DRAFT_978383 [Gymnopus androsaceus JB14]|uniref:Uncharacterized protein n=1 Tax=Gymnopus androsaceus JB14 TaxID=1447944 RepID=A0A6A4H918_9AGAR|nr:hypothetical protein BT96DRAFT_978383 [Gymnopus androsaceus JB14]
MGQDNKSPTSTAQVKLEEQPTNSLKRKTPPGDDENSPATTAVVVVEEEINSTEGDAQEQDEFRDEPRGSHTPPTPVHPQSDGEYDAGAVSCQTCKKKISFRDEATGEFSLKLWNQHREACARHLSNGNGSPPARFPQNHPRHLMSPNINLYSSSHPDSNDIFPVLMANPHPPTKRRRAKRTEEERIAYLRSDPYVADFEAYRVLCGSCNKWIRLRPNSTYCSIPWDAHRKSCLSKKISNKNTYALDERNSLFSKDPDVRKFDAERVLCAVCDQWIAINPEDHLEAVQKWLSHRVDCAKRAGGAAIMSGLEGSPPLHIIRRSVPPFSSHLMSGRNPTHRHLSPPSTAPYRSTQYSHNPYVHSLSRRNISPSGGRESLGRHRRTTDGGSNIKIESRESKEKIGNGEDQLDADADADADPDADADADGDPESDLEANHIRVDLPTSHPSQHVAPSSSSSSVAPADPSAPSVDGNSQAEPIIYSPAAGIFPPGPAHESRRRNAEQRAATLRSDELIKHVEPNRVFCSLCEKWVQLRQDSSYCAYPWYQHKGKCMARYQRRAQKAAEIEEIKKRRAMGSSRSRSMHTVGPHDPQRYALPPPYPPRPYHLHHPSTSHHHPHYAHVGPSHGMHPHSSRVNRGHHRGEDEELAYFSGSEPRHGSEDDEIINVRFKYRGLSASISDERSQSPDSVVSVEEEQDREYENAEYPRLRRTQSLQQNEGAEPDADADADGDADVDELANGEAPRGDCNGAKVKCMDVKEENGETQRKQVSSASQSQPPTSNGRPSSSRHRAIMPREAVPSRHRIEIGQDQNRRNQRGFPVPVPIQPGRPPHHLVANGGAGPYRSSHQQQREREYSNQDVGDHAYPHGSRVSRDRTHRAHRGQQQQSRSDGPYGSGALSSPASGSGRGVLADLDSPAGRKHFVSHSIAYLFQTTYDCSPCSADELSISALVAYLNAAMPMDKHEDFDTSEVVSSWTGTPRYLLADLEL